MAFKSPAYLQDLVGMEASNQATDYLRYQSEIAKQKAEMEARKRKEGSFGNRMKNGLTKAIPGALTGAATGLIAGGPVGMAAGLGIGAGTGFVGGALGGAAGNSVAALGAMAGGAAGKYLGDSPGAVNPTAFQDSQGLGGMSPREYQDYMKSISGGPDSPYAYQSPMPDADQWDRFNRLA